MSYKSNWSYTLPGNCCNTCTLAALGSPPRGRRRNYLRPPTSTACLSWRNSVRRSAGHLVNCDLNQKPKFISQVLCQEVHAATVLSLLVVADRHDAVELKNTCVKVHLSACLLLSNINLLKDPLFLCMIKSNKHHSGGCWAESGGGTSARVERCSEGTLFFFVFVRINFGNYTISRVVVFT